MGDTSYGRSFGGQPLGSSGAVVNTDDDPGTTIYVGSVDPEVAYSAELEVGDVWIQPTPAP